MSVLLLVLLLLLVAVNGFFVAAEFAIVRSRRARLEQLRDEGVPAAAKGLDLIDHVDVYVATCQVGITIASLGIGFLGEPALADLLEPLFGNVFSHAVAIGISIAFAFTTVTFLHVILGEQAPKMLAIARAESVLMRVARPSGLLPHGAAPADRRHQRPGELPRPAPLPRRCRRDRGGDLAGGAALADLARAPSAAASTPARPACSAASSTCTSRRRAR